MFGLLLLACHNDVEVVDLDGFGRVRSALWVRWIQDDYVYDSIELTTVRRACRSLQRWGSVNAEVRDELEDLDPNEYCRKAKDPLRDLAEAAASLYDEGDRWLHLYVGQEDDALMHEGDYSVGDDDEFLTGSLVYYLSNPNLGLDDWDESGGYEKNCGVDPDIAEDAVDVYNLGGGKLDIWRVERGEEVEGELNAHLERQAEEDAGDVVAEFRAEWCEVKF